MANTEKITVDEVRELFEAGEDVTIIDSRADDAWSSSDVKAGGALRVPPDAAEQHLADINRDHPIVVYCT